MHFLASPLSPSALTDELAPCRYEPSIEYQANPTGDWAARHSSCVASLPLTSATVFLTCSG